MSIRRSVAMTALLCLALAACGSGGYGGDSDDDPAPAPDAETGAAIPAGTFVGTSSTAPDAFAALVADDDGTAVLYVCDGTTDDLTIAESFTTDDLTNDPTLTSQPGGKTFTLTATTDGTITGAGTTTAGDPLDLDLAEATGDAGLYFSDQATDPSAWIVLPNGDFRGATKTDEGMVVVSRGPAGSIRLPAAQGWSWGETNPGVVVAAGGGSGI